MNTHNQQSQDAVQLEDAVQAVVESPRKVKAAPAPTLPPEVARALGLPSSPPTGDKATGADALKEVSPCAPTSASVFWDDETYSAATVEAAGLTIHLRELSEDTLFFVSSINARIEEATDGRVSAELAGHLFSGLEGAAPAVQSAAREVTPEDAVLIKTMITTMRDRALCEGIVSWAPAQRPCTNENKLKLGRRVRDECLGEIFRVSTLGEREADFLADSPSPSSKANRSKSSRRNIH